MRLRPRRRFTGSVAAATFLCGALLASVPAHSVASDTDAESRSASQALVTLEADHIARRAPRASARALTVIAARRPLTSVRTVLPVIATRVDDGGTTWLRVRVPGRPSGLLGWITMEETTSSSTPWAIDVSLAERTVVVSFHGTVLRRFRAVIGARRTPTPTGHFFVEEAVALDRDAEGGPFALAMSARSATLQEFNGGPGQIALHGTAGLSGAFGTASSHGCVRLSTAAITWLAGRIDAGTPVTVQR